MSRSTDQEKLISCILSDERAISLVSGKIDASYFTDEKLALIFSSALKLYSKKHVVTIDTIGADSGVDMRILVDLQRSGGKLGEIEFYCDRVIGGKLRAEAIAALEAGIKTVERAEAVEDAIDDVAGALSGIAPKEVGDRRPAEISTADLQSSIQFTQRIMETGEIPGCKSFITNIDRLFPYFSPSEFTIIAARPSVGKSTLALNIALNQAREGFTSIFYSLEMGRKEIVDRALASISGIGLGLIRTGRLSPDEWIRYTGAAETLSAYPGKVILACSGGATPARIGADIRYLSTKHKIETVFLDYIQLAANLVEGANIDARLTVVSNSLKSIAVEHDLHVVGLSQFNRQIEGKPQLSNLRGSGSLEQDANNVIFIHKEEKTDRTAEIIVAKQRNGPLGNTTVSHNPSICLFT